MSIPKIIHLCWFGRGEYPELAQMCIDSWKKHLSDYKIMVWNEDSFDVSTNLFTETAYKNRKWAFVSDYARLVALYEYGGVYMDTDLEVIRNFSQVLEGKHYVSSFVEGGLITCGFIAAEKGHPFIKSILAYYDASCRDSQVKLMMNPLIFTRQAMKMYGLETGCGSFENEEITIYPMDYFMPYKKNMFGHDPYRHEKYDCTENTYTIHHDMGSWAKKKKLKRFFAHSARFLLPKRAYLALKKKKCDSLLQKEFE